MKYGKQVVFGLILGISFIIGVPSFAQSSGTIDSSGFVLTGCIERSLKVTAYYTPLADQGVWFNGDFATEIKINGGNPHGSSGKPVFNGMLAGPKKYPFGTTVSIPGHGLGGIRDRGSAIISTGDYDRIDIRAGAGVQGMVNALWRGSRTLTGTLCSGGLVNQAQEFDRRNFPTWETASKQMMRTLTLEYGNIGVPIHYLQSFLEQLGYIQIISNTQDFDSTKTQFYLLSSNKGIFDTGTKLALCKFQQDAMGLPADDQYCGLYGTNTRRAFSKLIQEGKIRFPDVKVDSNTPLQVIKKKVKRMIRVRK